MHRGETRMIPSGLVPVAGPRPTILVAAGDGQVREHLEEMLRHQGYDVQTAGGGEEAVAYLASGYPAAAVVLDIMPEDQDGVAALREIRRMDPHLPVITLSGSATPPDIVSAIKSGATDVLAKPLHPEELRRALQNAVGGAGEAAAPAAEAPGMFFGRSPAMLALKASLHTIAGSNVPVLIEGETGTGKEMLARQLHALSPRAGKPFVRLNCAAVPAELMESELFGYERGAFTGAFQRKPGVFEMADGGTLLLDEIGDMDLRLQAKLLQVLQDQEFRRLGGRDLVRVDVRVLSATHCDLPRAVSEKAFREDLYYRLNVFSLALPPLRERKEDIPGIAEFLMRKHLEPGQAPVPLTERLRHAMIAFPWPGNVRQLENIIRKLLILRDPARIAAEIEAMHRQSRPVAPAAPPAPGAAGPQTPPARSRLEEVQLEKNRAEAEVILAALNATHWNRKQAAKRLQIEYKAFLYKMRKLSIEEQARANTLPA